MAGRNAENNIVDLQDSILKRTNKSQHHNNKENIITQKGTHYFLFFFLLFLIYIMFGIIDVRVFK